ncbi:MAG: outer membrane protein assembly factor BamA [Rubricoccaceae bacterium]|nr:outer membrane protein assembly factor BamA [Rubricoccaceae bacterium]
MPTTSRFVSTLLVLFGGMLWLGPTANAQGTGQQPQPRYEVLSIDVEGTTSAASTQYVLQQSGITVGQMVSLPYDEAFAEAVRKLYRVGWFSDVEVVADRILGEGVFLLIRVVEDPRLGSYTIEGVSGGERSDLEDLIPLLRGRTVRPSDIGRSSQIIESFFREKGYRQTEIEVDQTTNEDGRVDLVFNVTKGNQVEVQDVRFFGNEAFGEGKLRKQLDNTPENRWWRFWGGETFDDELFEEDLESLTRFYHDEGYFGARVVRDSVYMDEEVGGIVVEIEIEEGPRYFVRNVDFEGNTLYTDEQLRRALGFERGDPFSRTRLENNIYYNQEHTDIASLYSDRGYLRFNIRETITEAPNDSLDLFFEIDEGETYEFGEITIRGNTRTKEHVIRRELRTIPGQTYSRQALERTVRELLQLNYFDQSSLSQGPDVAVNEEDKTVDLTYNLTETGSDQLELSGGWGGSTGLLLQARVTFNNFSIQNLLKGTAWSPLPSGDGQQLSLSVVTNGRRYQNYSVSFTEPWFRGRRTPAGLSLGYTHFRDSSGEGRVSSVFSRLFYRQTLKWPDDFFQTGTDLGYRLYDIQDADSFTSLGLPEGASQEFTIRQSLTRNSLDNPIFPTAGSSIGLSVTIAPPVGDFVQYHKWDFSSAWHTPLAGNLSVSFKTQFGYIGSLTGEDVQFQRYLVGGSPLDTQGQFRGFGKDLIYMRGYPLEAISPRESGQTVGGRVLNKYSGEIQLVAIQSPSFSFAPYAFADAANTWDSFGDYDPGKLFRSAGFGARIFLPILGMLDLNYGYQIDSFLPRSSGDSGVPQWRFQFSLGGAQ